MPPASSATAQKRPIALVGMMGAGKSAVGKLLAARLGWPFLDSDSEVGREAGCTIAELFAREGEAAFRERERAVVAALLDGTTMVLATGGGAMAHWGTRTLLLERAQTIWLDAAPAILAHRLADKRNRPLLEDTDRQAALTRLLAKRRASYRLADHHLRTDNLGPGEVVDAVLKLLGC